MVGNAIVRAPPRGQEDGRRNHHAKNDSDRGARAARPRSGSSEAVSSGQATPASAGGGARRRTRAGLERLRAARGEPAGGAGRVGPAWSNRRRRTRALAAAGRGRCPPAAAENTACSANAAWRQWGTWPYEQRITDTTYWCAVYGGQITYRSSTASGSGTLCGSSWATSQLISGGIGYSWFVIRSSVGFACPTVVPWITLHPSHYEDISRNSWGSTAEVGSN